MTAIIMIAQLLVGLGILVFVHEGGHFLAAKAFKIRVPKFYLFFNPSISLVCFKKVGGKWKVKFFAKNLPDTEPVVDENGEPVLDEKGKQKFKLINLDKLPEDDWRKHPENTEYGIGWLPLGGYCQIAGMIDETQSVENLATEPQPWEYRSKPAWQRLIVVLAGVIVNLIVGVLLFAFVLGHYEKEYLPLKAVTDGVYAFEQARNLGFQTGDKIISVDGKTFERYQDAVSAKMYFGSIVTIERDGMQKDIVIGDEYNLLKSSNGMFLQPYNFPALVDSVFPIGEAQKAGIQKGDVIIGLDTIVIGSYGALIEYREQFANRSVEVSYLHGNDTLSSLITFDSTAMLGVAIASMPYQTKTYTIGQSLHYGWSDAMKNLWLNLKGFEKLFSGEEKLTSLSGPVGIAQIYGGVWNWAKFWYITALLSVILAFMNVLPIPGLDGGHALFTFIELLTGKKVPDSVLQYAQTIGMILLLLLMFFVIGNDIFKLFK